MRYEKLIVASQIVTRETCKKAFLTSNTSEVLLQRRRPDQAEFAHVYTKLCL
jgi:hypothetical protein